MRLIRSIQLASGKRPTRRMPNANDTDRLRFNKEDNAEDARLASVQELPHIALQLSVFGRDSAAQRMVLQRIKRLTEIGDPALSRFRRMTANPKLRVFEVAFGQWLKPHPERHVQS